MKFFKKTPAWLIGGIIGLIYFLITYLIDRPFPNSFLFPLLNLPSLLILFEIDKLLGYKLLGYLQMGNLYLLFLAVLDFILGSVLGLLIGGFVNFLRKVKIKKLQNK